MLLVRISNLNDAFFYLRNILPPLFQSSTNDHERNESSYQKSKIGILLTATKNYKKVYCGDKVYFLLHRLVCGFRKRVIIVLKWRQIKNMRWFIKNDFVMSLSPTMVNDFRREVINVLKWCQIKSIRKNYNCKRIAR